MNECQKRFRNESVTRLKRVVVQDLWVERCFIRGGNSFSMQPVIEDNMFFFRFEDGTTTEPAQIVIDENVGNLVLLFENNLI